MRDQLDRFRDYGAEVVGLSAQSPELLDQARVELGIAYTLISDQRLALADDLPVPTFEFAGRRYFQRLTLITEEAVIKESLYPVVPPNDAAAQALRVLEDMRGTS